MATSKELKLKLIVDKEKKKVLFAESGKDFVDILFSFLTMPLGSVIRILNKQSSLGCMDKLYQSIENLDECYFNTEACKEMLLRPLNSCGKQCEDLILRIDESNPRTFFCCQKFECRPEIYPYFSLVPQSRCPPGHSIDFGLNWAKEEHRGPNGDGVFLRGMANFIIGDDLVVMPASTMNMLNFFEKHGIKDLDNIEEICIDMDVNMLHDLLKRSLVSKYPLSGMYFQKTDSTENLDFCLKSPKIEDILVGKESKKAKAKIFVSKSSNKVLYAEAEGGLVDLLFNVLTIPLGTVIKLLNKSSAVVCLDNLYRSVENLCSDPKYLKPDASNLLLNPKLAAHFNYSDSLLDVGEKDIFTGFLHCHKCLLSKTVNDKIQCMHRIERHKVTELNPKLKSSTEVGGSYAKVEVKFLISDELEIKPFSTICSIQAIRECQASFAGLEEKEIDIDEAVALKLLKSCLTSQSPLSDVFLPKKKKNRLMI